jgi:enoyl-CoA hydratase/carnithine racemase
MAGTVSTEDRNGVRTVTLNRPERLNALNRELLDDLRAALDDALADEQVGALVLCGAGRAFCSGDDLKDFEDQTGGEAATRSFIESIQEVTRRIVLGDKVVVGAIHGWAVGGGLEWVINCDLAVFAESAKCFFPEIKWGMFPTGGVTAILPRIVGLAKTRELMLFGETFGAAEALEMGLAWKVVPDDAVFETAHEAAEKIAALPQGAVSDLKRVLNRAGSLDVEGALELETEATIRGFLDPQTVERVRHFGS